jgi:hypothetical protein
MANQQVIIIRLELPSPDEAAALAQFVKRIDYDSVGHFTSTFVFYSGRTEHDVAWSAICLVQRQLADAGFNPR